MTCSCYEGIVGQCWQQPVQTYYIPYALVASASFLLAMVITRLLDLWADGYFKKGKSNENN